MTFPLSPPAQDGLMFRTAGRCRAGTDADGFALTGFENVQHKRRLALRGVAGKEYPMDRTTAMTLFNDFEKLRNTGDEEPLAPVFQVRLDAASARSDDARSFRLRLTSGPWGVNTDDWRYVFDRAHETEVALTIDNTGIELS